MVLSFRRLQCAEEVSSTWNRKFNSAPPKSRPAAQHVFLAVRAFFSVTFQAAGSLLSP